MLGVGDASGHRAQGQGKRYERNYYPAEVLGTVIDGWQGAVAVNSRMVVPLLQNIRIPYVEKGLWWHESALEIWWVLFIQFFTGKC